MVFSKKIGQAGDHFGPVRAGEHGQHVAAMIRGQELRTYSGGRRHVLTGQQGAGPEIFQKLLQHLAIAGDGGPQKRLISHVGGDRRGAMLLRLSCPVPLRSIR